MANILKDLAAALATGGIDAVPAGWKTLAQLVDECGMSGSHTSRIVRAGVAAGRVEVRRFRVPTPHAGPRTVAHYLL